MTDLRTRNNASSKKSYEKSVERQYADDYEHEMVRQHVLTIPDTDAYHWSIVPEEYLYESGYISDFNKHRLERLMKKKDKKEGENRVRDYGFDGLARTRIGSSVVFNGLQAKYYIHKQVCAGDIGSFFAMQISLTLKNPLSKGYLYTTSGLQADLAGNVANPSYPIRHVLHSWKHPDARTAPIVPPTQQECDKLLRADQVDALKQLEDKDGINALNTPCRWGKTIVAGHHTKRINAKLVVAIAPLLVSVENLQERLACFIPGYSSLLVDSDTGGTTNVEEIKKFLASEGNHIIYSTFKSAVDILSELLTDCEDKYILGDEIHNANPQLCEFVQQFPKGLVMSATMPEEIVNQLDINHTVYIPFAQAIRDGIVVDYTLWLPHLTKASDGTTSVDIEIPVEFSTYDSDLTAKAFYLATVMLKTGSRRCIAYLGRQEDCDLFIEVVTQIFEIYHGLTIWTGKIDSTISKIKRKGVIEEFQTGQGDVYHVLTSVRILDEAVDIPRCDSVFITNVGEHSSDIRMMQRSQRSSTKDPKNPSKHNNIILWADGWEKCVGALDLLREADPEFHKKVRIADCNYDRSGESARIDSVKKEEIEFAKWDNMKCLTSEEKQLLIIEQLYSFHEKYKETPTEYGNRENEKQLYLWINNRRQDKKKGRLSLKMEISINTRLPWFSWDIRLDRHIKMITELIIFYEKYKELPKQRGIRDNESQLDCWIRERRISKNNNKLPLWLENEISIKLPWFSWDPYWDLFVENVQKINNFYELYKQEPCQKGVRNNNEESGLGSWLSSRRQSKIKGTLTDKEESYIIGHLPWFSWNPRDDIHIKTIAEIVEFYKKYGEEPKKTGKREGEATLFNWISRRRIEKKRGALSPSIPTRIQIQLPWFSWDPHMDTHKKIINDLLEFYKIYKEEPKKKGTRTDEALLSAWMGSRRNDKKKGRLSEELEKIISDSIPWFSWDPIQDMHKKMISDIVTFYKKYKYCPKQKGVLENGNEAKMATYISNRRHDKKLGKLTLDIENSINEKMPWFVWVLRAPKTV